MRFIIVLGVLLCLVQLFVGANRVECVVASYSNGKWTPLEDARMVKARACGYSMSSNTYGITSPCSIHLHAADHPLPPEFRSKCLDNGESTMCGCESDKCNVVGENLRKLKAKKLKNNHAFAAYGSNSYGMGNYKRSADNAKHKAQNDAGTAQEEPAESHNNAAAMAPAESHNNAAAMAPAESHNNAAAMAPKEQPMPVDTLEPCNTEEILKSMPKYDTLSPRKLLKCRKGYLFEYDEWTDYNDLDITAKQEGCQVQLEFDEDCRISSSGLKKLNEKFKCEALGNLFFCGCSSGDDCHMDIQKTISEAEKFVKEGKMKPEFAKCMDKWKAVPSQFLPTTPAPPESATSEIHTLFISASVIFISNL